MPIADASMRRGPKAEGLGPNRSSRVAIGLYARRYEAHNCASYRVSTRP